MDIIANNSPAVIPVHFGGASIDLKRFILSLNYIKLLLLKMLLMHLVDFIPMEAVLALDLFRFDNSIFSSSQELYYCEGGAITTNNDIYRYLLRMRSHGIVNRRDLNRNDGYTDGNINPWYYEMQDLGFHYRITDIQASLGLSQLKKLDKFIDARREHLSYTIRNLTLQK